MTWLYTAIGWVLRICYKITPNYALALLLFALFFKLVLLPFGYKQQKNQLKMYSLRPKQMAIEKKYAGRNDQPTLRKKQMEIQEMMQKEGASPMGGCLPMLLQFPIIIALYNVIRSPFTYMLGLGKEGAAKVMEAVYALNGQQVYHSEIDSVRFVREHWGQLSHLFGGKELPGFSLFGLDLARDPNMEWNIYLLVPVITFISMYLTMTLTQKWSYNSIGQNEQQAQTLGMMNLLMPIMSTIFTFSVPVALAVYWIYQNVFGVLQQFILFRAMPAPTFTEEDYRRAEEEILGKTRRRKKGSASGGAPAQREWDPDRPRPRSLHHIDDEDYNQPAPAPQKSEAAKAPRPSMLDGVSMQQDTDNTQSETRKESKDD